MPYGDKGIAAISAISNMWRLTKGDVDMSAFLEHSSFFVAIDYYYYDGLTTAAEIRHRLCERNKLIVDFITNIVSLLEQRREFDHRDSVTLCPRDSPAVTFLFRIAKHSPSISCIFSWKFRFIAVVSVKYPAQWNLDDLRRIYKAIITDPPYGTKVINELSFSDEYCHRRMIHQCITWRQLWLTGGVTRIEIEDEVQQFLCDVPFDLKADCQFEALMLIGDLQEYGNFDTSSKLHRD
jgi:hypothetical protein